MRGMYYKGYNQAKEDAKKMGLKWAKNLLDLREKCTGVDEHYTKGYKAGLKTLEN